MRLPLLGPQEVLDRPQIQILLFTAKCNEVLNQVAFAKSTLNEIKELTKVLGDYMFVENCNVQ